MTAFHAPETAEIVARLRALLAAGVHESDSGWYISDYTTSGLSVITEGLQSGMFPVRCEGPQATLIVETINALPTLLSTIERQQELLTPLDDPHGYANAYVDWEKRAESLEEERDRLMHVIDRDRYIAASCHAAIKAALYGRQWLCGLGRGPYEWDDDRYQAEFADAFQAIDASLELLATLAADKSDCTRDELKVSAARTAARTALAASSTSVQSSAGSFHETGVSLKVDGGGSDAGGGEG